MQTKTEILDRAMAEIRFDVYTKRVPETVADFSELHDYVDANSYGGFCDENYTRNHDFIWDVQQELNAWIIGGMK